MAQHQTRRTDETPHTHNEPIFSLRTKGVPRIVFSDDIECLETPISPLVGRSPSVIRQTKNRRWRGCSVRLPLAHVLPDEAEVPREVLVRSGKAYSLEAPSFGNYLRFSLSVLKFVSQIRNGHEFKIKQQPGRSMGIP